MKLRHLLLFAALCISVGSGHAATNDAFAQGLELSLAGRFPEAAAAFASAVKQQPSAGALVNLGNVEWQRGHAGAAILAWEQAQWLDPYDARAGANLKFARQVTQVDEPSLRWFEAASTWLPPNAWVWLAGASLWLAVGGLVLPGVFRRQKTGWQQTLTALAAGLFLFSLTANVGVVSRTQIGFVLGKNTPLRLTPTRESELISTLTSGEPARLLRTRGNYVFIHTGLGTGWVERAQLGLICPE